MKKIFALVLSIVLMISSLYICVNAKVTEVPVENLKESEVLPERSTWKITASNSWKWGAAENMLDGDIKTMWHSYYKEQDGKAVDKAPAPYYIDIELPEKAEITGFVYAPRQDIDSGYVFNWEAYSVSDDGKEELLATGEFARNKNAKVASWQGKETKKIRVVFTKTTGVGTCAELYLLGKGEDASLFASSGNATADEKEGVDASLESKVLPERSTWTITSSSSLSWAGPERMLDGNVKTYWHSYYKEQDGKAVDKTPAPYYIDIELPEESVVKGFTYVPRQDNNSGYVFNWEAYKIGDDGTETKLGAGSLANDVNAKSGIWNEVSLKKIRIVFTKTTGVGTCAELYLIGKGESGVKAAVPEKKEEVKDSNVNDKGWIVTASSEKNWAPGIRAFDGKMNTYWHTDYEEEGGKVISHDMPPHDLKVTFPEKKVITGFSIYPRQGTDSKAGLIEEYNFYVSDSDDGEYFLLFSESTSATSSTKTVDFACGIEVKRVWIEITIGYSGYAVIAEVEFHEGDENTKVVPYESFSEEREANRLYKIDNTAITVTDPDDNPSWSGSPGSLVDGSERGFWQTERLDPGTVVCIRFDLGEVRNFTHISILPRPSEDFHGYMEKFNVYVSEDGDVYKELLYDYSFEESEKSLSEKFIFFEEGVKARYVEFEVTEYFNFRVSCAEVSFWQNKEMHDKTSDSGKYVLKIGSPEIEITKGGETYTKTMDVAPFITSRGQTMIPLRGLIEEMGMDIEWKDKTQEIILSKGIRIINLQIRNKLVKVEGTPYGDVTYTLYSPPKIKDSRTFVPVRFLSEQMGYTVNWDGETKTVTIEKQ